MLQLNEKVFKIEDVLDRYKSTDPDEKPLVVYDSVSDFEGKVTLMVPFAYEAVVIKDGEMLETLSSGKHEINAQSKVKGVLFKKVVREDVHNYQVFYINKTVTLICKWGTPNQMKVFDPFLKVPVNVGAYGTFDIHLLNSRKLLLKLVGNIDGLTTEGLRRFFADKLIMRVKDILANAMVTSNINFYELPTKLVAISDAIQASVKNIFEDYGVEVVNFSINNIHIPDADTKALEDVIKKKRILEVQDKDFKSEDAAKVEAMKLQADLAVKLAEVEAEKKTKPAAAQKFCTNCGAKITANQKFCNECGEKVQKGE